MSGALEFPLLLPHGYCDGEGVLHREGAMRMATAFDEIAPLKDPRVQSNPDIWSSSCSRARSPAWARSSLTT